MNMDKRPKILLVSVHGHTLRVPAEFPVGRRADRAAGVTAHGAAFLEGEQLLGTEALVVDLRCGLDKILEMGAGKEVTEVDELAVVFIFDCHVISHHNPPSVLRSIIQKLCVAYH